MALLVQAQQMELHQAQMQYAAYAGYAPPAPTSAPPPPPPGEQPPPPSGPPPAPGEGQTGAEADAYAAYWCVSLTWPIFGDEIEQLNWVAGHNTATMSIHQSSRPGLLSSKPRNNNSITSSKDMGARALTRLSLLHLPLPRRLSSHHHRHLLLREDKERLVCVERKSCIY